MSSSAYVLKNIFKLNEYEYKTKIKSSNFDNEIEDIEEDLLYRKYINTLEQQVVQEYKKTNIGIEQVMEKMEQEMKRVKLNNKVRLTFIINSLLCFIFSFTTLLIYYLAVLDKVNLNPIYVIIWIPVSFGAWLANSINYEIWESNNGEL
jgi:hypothetical protein